MQRLQLSTRRGRRLLAVGAGLLALACTARPAPEAAVPARPAPTESEAHAPTAAPSSSAPGRHADVPAIAGAERPELSVALWQERHEAQLHAPQRAGARLVVLGDSIADGWYASRSFDKQWRREHPLNLALPGEQTQELLWRIEHGALDGLEPRVAVLLVGVYNLAAGFSPEETATGIRAVLERVRAKLPRTRVLVVSLLPAGQASSDPLRAQIEATNRELSALAEPDQVVVVDVGGMFINDDGTISASVMSDFLRPTALGYQALTTALSLVTRQLLQQPTSN